MAYTNVVYESITCKECNSEFAPNRRDKKFCSKSCYRKYGKKHLNHSKGNAKNLARNLALRTRPYIRFKKDVCQRCGFVPEHKSQLDVDHIDGDHNNNYEDNLQTLCANCHRLKTALQLKWSK